MAGMKKIICIADILGNGIKHRDPQGMSLEEIAQYKNRLDGMQSFVKWSWVIQYGAELAGLKAPENQSEKGEPIELILLWHHAQNNKKVIKQNGVQSTGAY